MLLLFVVLLEGKKPTVCPAIFQMVDRLLTVHLQKKEETMTTNENKKSDMRAGD